MAGGRGSRIARASIAAGVVIVVGIAGIAMSFATGTRADIWKTGAYFAGALVVSLAVLAGIAWLMLRGLKLASRRKLPTSIRHGIANLYRPGNHAQTVLVALGIGVMFTLTVYLVRARRDRADEPDRAARHAQCLSHRHRAQGSSGCSGAAEKAARHRRDHRTDRYRRGEAGGCGWRGCRRKKC